jgi:3-hydroxybutyrate dehydrogenase
VWNFWHTFWTMRKALNAMIPQSHGRILAISSVEGKAGKPGISTYVAAKHAINGLVKSAAKEVGTMGITVNALCPGAIETDVMAAEGPGAAASMGMTYQGLLDMFASESAIKRLNEVEDVAEVAVLLASAAGAGITGSLISIDGGTSPY